MRRAILGLFSYAEFVLLGFVFLLPLSIVFVATRRDPTRRLRGRWMRRFGRATSWLTPLWRFGASGTPPVDRAYVVVANHESSADPFLLSWLPWDMRWIAKAEMFRTPLTGWLMHLGGDIPLRRGDRESVEAMMTACRETLAGGLSVMLFPEGTRSPDGRLLPFKDGAFQLAIDAGVPVLPLALAGTRQCRPKGSLWFGEARARVRILEPVSTEGMTSEDLPRLRELVRERIATAANELRAELGLEPPRPVSVAGLTAQRIR